MDVGLLSVGGYLVDMFFVVSLLVYLYMHRAMLQQIFLTVSFVCLILTTQLMCLSGKHRGPHFLLPITLL